MQKNRFLFGFLIMVLCSCTSNKKPSFQQIEIWKSEVMETELAFSKMAKSEGIPAAFLSYAAEDAVLMRNNKLILGKIAIKNLMSSQASGKVELSWKPEFIDVSASGDLAYTYGYFTYTSTDSAGKADSQSGVFHTIWKRQEDGSWKYVWD